MTDLEWLDSWIRARANPDQEGDAKTLEIWERMLDFFLREAEET